MRLPNFLIIGAHKAGTTSLYFYLKEHPDIYMSPIKEPRFFAFNPANPDHHMAKSLPIKTMDAYLKLFSGVSHERAIGEASPNYLHSRTAAKAIHFHIPAAKLIVSLRDPVQRTISAYSMLHRQGHEHRTLDEALWNDEKLLRSSLYYEDLKHYIDLFGREQVKVLLFDDLKADSLGVMKELYRYLEVDDGFRPDISVQHNIAANTNSKTMRLVRKVYYAHRGVRRTIRSFVPHEMRRRIGKIGSKEVETSTELARETHDRLAEYYYDDILRLQDLIQRDLSAWLQSGSAEASATAASMRQ
jgi:hypothetical protein